MYPYNQCDYNIPQKSPYAFENAVLDDIKRITNLYKSLTAEWSNYDFTQWACKNLLRLSGTIPISFQNAEYHIPINIWFTSQYPYSPPHIYVVASSTIAIYPNKYVHSDGFVSHPSLDSWAYPNNYDIISLIAILRIEFGKVPPLYDISNNPQSYTQTSYANTYQPPPIGNSFAADQKNSEKFVSLSNKWESISIQLERLIHDALVPIRKQEVIHTSYSKRLDDGFNTLSNILQEIKVEQTKLEDDIKKRETAIFKLEEAIENINSKLKPDINQAVSPSTPLHAQMLAAISEDEAAKDMYFYLTDAVQHKIISVDDYLAEVSSIAVKQFKNRALVMKAIKICNKES